MKIAVEGCAHGELNKIYETIKYLEHQQNFKVDLLICCGDFQSHRNQDDMRSMAAPRKYQEMKDFHEYYTGRRTAPVLTLFIGGNHESANYLWELPYGGWVAENIYYMGYAGVVTFGGLRIGGLSGIYKDRDYYKGHFESPPFNDDTKRSFYHVRSCDVAKLKLLSGGDDFDMFASHDWPHGIYNHGDKHQLIRFKPFLRDEIMSNTLGSYAAEDLLQVLKPTHWFSGHMHARFTAVVNHTDTKVTKFLALDKCLPKRKFLQVIDMGPAAEECVLKYDVPWLCVLQATNDVFSKSSKKTFLTELSEDYKPTESKMDELRKNVIDFHVIPFSKSIDGKNDQTTTFCQRFSVLNPCVHNPSTPLVNNKYGSSQKTFQRKLVIPKPKFNTATSSESSDEFSKRSLHVKNDDDFNELSNPNISSNPDDADNDDEFNELTNPNISSNPDEIDLSDSSSDNDDSVNEKQTNKTFQYNSNMSTVESPCVGANIRTPFKTPSGLSRDTQSISVIPEDDVISNTDSNNITSNSDTNDVKSSDETPQPKKRMKIIRRNQEVYSTSGEETT